METTNAADAYRAARERLDERLNRLNHLVREHAERQRRDPGNWGYAGDVNHLVEVLDEAIAFLGEKKEAPKSTAIAYAFRLRIGESHRKVLCLECCGGEPPMSASEVFDTDADRTRFGVPCDDRRVVVCHECGERLDTAEARA